ncbi:MAG: hypothetical protein H7315_13765 [Herminiimonas sp.]|nr:hypothetical protein [Herminiimonas sp.]
MKNPWTKKNPFMSMWLSGANAVAGAARSHATAAVKKQATSLVNEGTRQMGEVMSGKSPKAASKTKKRR